MPLSINNLILYPNSQSVKGLNKRNHKNQRSQSKNQFNFFLNHDFYQLFIKLLKYGHA